MNIEEQNDNIEKETNSSESIGIEGIDNNEQKNKENTANINETINQSSNSENGKKAKKSGPIKVIARIISVLAWTAVIIVLILLVYTAVSKKTDIFGHRMYLIMSGSMEPEISAKDAVVTKKQDEYHLGDVIAYEEDNVTVVHRIIEEKNEGSSKYFRTKGDANNTEDMDIVTPSQIKGIVKYRWPAVGRIILFVQSNLIIFIIAIFILLVISIVRRLM